MLASFSIPWASFYQFPLINFIEFTIFWPLHQRQNANPRHSVFRENIICIYKHTNTLSHTHSFSFWRPQTMRTGPEFNVTVHFHHPSMLNIELTYRNSSCHLGFCCGSTSCASRHTIWKDKQEIPGCMGRWGRPPFHPELGPENSLCNPGWPQRTQSWPASAHRQDWPALRMIYRFFSECFMWTNSTLKWLSGLKASPCLLSLSKMQTMSNALISNALL